MRVCPLDGRKMHKRIYLVIQGEHEMKRVDWICEKCDASVTEYNGVPQVFNSLGMFLGVIK